MEKTTISETLIRVTLNEKDIESAIRQFIISCHPELEKGWHINPFPYVKEQEVDFYCETLHKT